MNNPMKIKFKKLVSHATTPKKSHIHDAGYDLTVVDIPLNNYDYDYVEYGTGIAVSIPEGYVGLLFPRSSISKTPFSLANSVGVIDPGYTGEIKVRFKRLQDDKEDLEYKFGDRVIQLIIMKTEAIEFEECDDLDSSKRGTGGFGSTGR